MRPLQVAADKEMTGDDPPPDDPSAPPTQPVTHMDTFAAGAIVGVATFEALFAVKDCIDEPVLHGNLPPMDPKTRFIKTAVPLARFVGGLFAMPYDPTIPGFPIRVARVGIQMLGAYLDLTPMILSASQPGRSFGFMTPTDQRRRKIVDTVAALVVFPLSMVVIHDELGSSREKWRDYSVARSWEHCGADLTGFAAQICEMMAFVADKEGEFGPAEDLMEWRLGLLGIKVFFLVARFVHSCVDGASPNIFSG